MIDSTKFGEITIEGKTHYSDVFVYWDGEVEETRTFTRHLFSKEELNILLKKNPEVVIVGTGDSGFLKVSDDARAIAKEKDIELIELITSEAIRKFNELVESGKKVVAFMHVEC